MVSKPKGLSRNIFACRSGLHAWGRKIGSGPETAETSRCQVQVIRTSRICRRLVPSNTSMRPIGRHQPHLGTMCLAANYCQTAAEATLHATVVILSGETLATRLLSGTIVTELASSTNSASFLFHVEKAAGLTGPVLMSFQTVVLSCDAWCIRLRAFYRSTRLRAIGKQTRHTEIL